MSYLAFSEEFAYFVVGKMKTSILVLIWALVLGLFSTSPAFALPESIMLIPLETTNNQIVTLELSSLQEIDSQVSCEPVFRVSGVSEDQPIAGVFVEKLLGTESSDEDSSIQKESSVLFHYIGNNEWEGRIESSERRIVVIKEGRLASIQGFQLLVEHRAVKFKQSTRFRRFPQIAYFMLGLRESPRATCRELIPVGSR